MSNQDTVKQKANTSSKYSVMISVDDVLKNSERLVHNQVDITNRDFDALSRAVSKIFDRHKQEVRLCQENKTND